MFPSYVNMAQLQAPSISTSRPLKRKQSTSSSSPGHVPKRSKSENVSQLKRYLIGCAHLLYVKADSRQRDTHNRLIPVAYPPKKAYAPSSDFPQKEMVALYFDDIDRTVVSQSKSKSHLFAAPDFSIMYPYLFPWIHFNISGITQFVPSRRHIRHMAFRIWEYLATDGRVMVKHEDGSGEENFPLGDVRGWWWEADGAYPIGYEAWHQTHNENTELPGTILIHFRTKYAQKITNKSLPM